MILALAVVLRFYQLGHSSLWIDEAFTWWFTSKPWLSLFDTLRLDGVNPPLYYLPIKVVSTLFGDAEFSLRITSTIMGVIVVIIGMALGNKLSGKYGLIAAGIYLAFHPMTIWYARDARPYALVSSLALLGLLLFLTLRSKNELKYWIFSYLALSLGFLTHYYFFLIGGVLVLFALVDMRKDPIFFRQWVGLTLLAFIPLVAWILWYFQQPEPAIGIGWIERPRLSDPIATLWNLFSGYGGRITVASTLFGSMVLLLAAIALINSREDRLEWKAFLLGLAIPICGVWLVSQRRPVYMDRYFIVLLPFVVLLVSRGAQRAWEAVAHYQLKLRPGAGFIAAAMLAGIGLWAAIQVYTAEQYAREDWRGLANTLNERGEAVPSVWLSDREAIIPFQYYYKGDIQPISSEQPPLCQKSCWWVMRQPYTGTHAFGQGVSDPNRPWIPELPEACQLLDRWDSPSGIAAWKIHCD